MTITIIIPISLLFFEVALFLCERTEKWEHSFFFSFFLFVCFYLLVLVFYYNINVNPFFNFFFLNFFWRARAKYLDTFLAPQVVTSLPVVLFVLCFPKLFFFLGLWTVPSLQSSIYIKNRASFSPSLSFFLAALDYSNNESGYRAY